jgi:hypothetical protein
MSEQETTEPATASTAGAGELALSFEAWADLAARMLGMTPEQRQEVLDEHDIDAADWTRCEADHVEALTSDITGGRTDRTDLYAGKCVAEMERRRSQASSHAKAEAEPEPPPAEPAPDLPIGAPQGAEPEHVPTFFKEPPAAASPYVRPPAELAGTAMAFELPTALRQGALPFNPSAAPTIAASSGPPAERRRPPVGSETVALGGTLPVAANLADKAALPFAGAAAPPPPKAPSFPRLPLSAYASLCAELAEHPDQGPAVLAKYNVLSPEAQAALDQSWRERFGKYPDTHTEFQSLVMQYRAWLRGQPRA